MTRNSIKVFLAATALTTATAFSASAGHHAEMKKDAGMAQTTIVEAAVATDALSTLVAAVTAADLVDTLNSDGPFTVFAPTNDAFAALPAGTVDSLLLPENKHQLQDILKAHVVAGKLTSTDLVAKAQANGGKVKLKTVSGDYIKGLLAGDTLYLLDENRGISMLKMVDLDQSNGVVHVVDRVLLPK